MKKGVLPFHCVRNKESEVFINLKANRPARILGSAILDKVKTDSHGHPVTCSVRKGEAKIRNLPKSEVFALRQWTMVKALDMLAQNEWILEMKTYRYAAGRLDGHDRVCWRLVAYPSELADEQMDALDAQGLHGTIQLSLL